MVSAAQPRAEAAAAVRRLRRAAWARPQKMQPVSPRSPALRLGLPTKIRTHRRVRGILYRGNVFGLRLPEH